MATATNEADEIRRRMAEIRLDLHQNVREVVASAEAVADWRRHIRSHPWIALGTAMAVGYFLVPGRGRTNPTMLVSPPLEALGSALPAEPKEAKRRSSIMGTALGFAGPLVARAAQAYALQYLENWITSQAMPPASPRGPGPEPRPAEPRPRVPPRQTPY